MPNMDKTGPMGQGPRTGRQMGNCEGTSGNFFCKRGFGRGFGRGVQPIELSKEEKQKILKAQKEDIEKELKQLKDE